MAPTNIPRIGLVNTISRWVNCGTWASGSTAPLIVSIPNIRTVNPINMDPRSFFFSCFAVMIRKMPINARIGVKDDGFSKRIKKFSLWIPVRLNSQDVTVVPMLAPIIMPTACPSFMIPEFTNPTTVTVVAEDDRITAVTPAPSRTALIGLLVNFSKIFSRRPPDILVNPSPITFIPYKNNARPPINVRT